MSGSPPALGSPAPELGLVAPNSLVTACYSSLTTAPLDHASLEQLPQHVLVQLLTQAVADRDQAQEKVVQQAEQLFKLANEKKGQYVINPPSGMDRVGHDMYERVQAVTAKWVPRSKTSDFTADWAVSNYEKRAMTYDLNDNAIIIKPYDIPRKKNELHEFVQCHE